MHKSISVPFLDLASGYQELKKEFDNEVERVLSNGIYILGSEVENFEFNYADYCSAKYAIGVANGFDALHLALRVMGVGEGDEVIVPSHTYIATWLAVSHTGATPVPVEPDETYNIDPKKIEAAITSRTKVILPVHLYGQSADLDSISLIAEKYGLKILEDAAQAHGARYKGQRIGAHSDLVAWSFYPGKNLGAFGDGGAITTNSQEMYDRLRVLRNYGSRDKYINEVIGFNSRLDPIQAAVLQVKLNHLDDWNKRRVNLAARYLNALKNTSLILPVVPDWTDSVWHLFVVRYSKRDWLQEELLKEGIETLIHYPIPPNLQKSYLCTENNEFNLAIAENLANEVLSLPIGPHLSLEQQDYVINTLLRLL